MAPALGAQTPAAGVQLSNRARPLATAQSAAVAPAIAAGYVHSMALNSDGMLWAWGYGGSGQLGNGSNASVQVPVPVVGPGGIGFLTGMTAISIAADHSLALRNDGTVWALGNNFHGELGNNGNVSSLVPVQVVGPGGVGNLAGVTSIAAGGVHSLALKNDGTVWAWGNGYDGGLGNNSNASSSVPVQVVGPGGVGNLAGVTSIAAGGRYSLALKNDGTVWAWGNGYDGGLGNNSNASSSVPVQVTGPGGVGILTGVTAIAAGGSHASVLQHSIALRSDGSVWGWGNGANGLLGNNSTASSSVPVQVVGPGGVGNLAGVTAIAAGFHHSAALKSDGTVWTWGDGYEGVLGRNSTASSSVPVQVVGPGGVGNLAGVTAIGVGWGHSMALKGNGTLWTWGSNQYGGLGNNGLSSSYVPVQVVGPGGVGFLNLGSGTPPPPAACASRASTWTAGSSSCSATYPGGQSGTNTTLTDSIGPDTGAATASCTDGQVTLTALTCVTAPPPPTDCASQVMAWTVGTSSCSATYPGGQSGTSATLSDIVAPTTGTVTAICTNGQLALTAQVCVTAPQPPQPIDLSAEIPPVTGAPPISLFPAPGNLLNLLTGVAPFIENSGSHLSPDARVYIQQQIQALQDQSSAYHPLSPLTKHLFDGSATLLKTGFGSMKAIFDIAASAAAASVSTITHAELAMELSGMASTITSLPPLSPHDPQLLTLTKRASDIMVVAYTAFVGTGSGVLAGDPFLALVAADLIIWGDYVPEQMAAFAVDPAVLNYKIPVPVVISPHPIVVGTRTAAFINRFNDATLRCVAMLEAVNASFDRYSSAWLAGDNLAAATQMAAYLHYLRLLGVALADARSSFDELPTILRQEGVVARAGNTNGLRALQNVLSTSGMPLPFASYLVKNGLAADSVPAYLSAITKFSFDPGPNIYASITLGRRAIDSLFARQIKIDIKPGDLLNVINLGSDGSVPIAILSDASFDATKVSPASIIFSGAGVKNHTVKQTFSCLKKDVNADGRLDLLCKIETRDLDLHPGDTVALLTATTFDGEAIAGMDFVAIRNWPRESEHGEK